MSGNKTSKKRAAARLAPPPPAPAAAELLTAPVAFGRQLAAAEAPAWHYWPVVFVGAVLAGLAYALLLRPGINLAAAEALRAADRAGNAAPTFLSHITNGFGSFFLSILTFLVMWGLGHLGAGRGERPAKVAEVYSASFVLVVPLYLLCLLVTLFTPATSWALDPQSVLAAEGNLLDLQRAALQRAAQTPAALALIGVTLLGTATQFALAFPALRETTGSARRAALATGLPLLPALFIQFLGVAPLVLSR